MQKTTTMLAQILGTWFAIAVLALHVRGTIRYRSPEVRLLDQVKREYAGNIEFACMSYHRRAHPVELIRDERLRLAAERADAVAKDLHNRMPKDQAQPLIDTWKQESNDLNKQRYSLMRDLDAEYAAVEANRLCLNLIPVSEIKKQYVEAKRAIVDAERVLEEHTHSEVQ